MPAARDKVRIGIMGCANIARRSVIPALRELERLFEVTAIASRDYARASSLANEFGCLAIDGYEALVTMPDVDAVYIPLPTGLHKKWINRALDAGLHVYAEKSLAMCYRDAQDLVLNASARSLALMEGYMFQYHTQHNFVREIINSGEIGECRFFSSSFGFPPLQHNDFRYDAELGGGVLMDAAGYPLRAAHCILGSRLEVKGSTMYFDPITKVNMWGSAFLADPNGIGASISFGFDNYYQCRYEIWGSKGRLIAERAFTPLPDYSPSIILDKNGASEVIKAKPDNHFIKALQEFYRIVRDPAARQKHYDEILLQSRSLQLISEFAKNGKIMT